MASGLRFPEGPVACSDGSVLLVEIARGTLTRVHRDGRSEVVAECGGGPNGCAVGPDGAAWITNNGGCFDFIDLGGMVVPGPLPSTWCGGSIQRVDLASGNVSDVYTHCDGRPLRAPNDLVFDAHGGFWFTDFGVREDRTSDRTGVFYALADGSSIREVLFPLDAPNGIGLSPDGSRLYVAETYTGRLYAWDVPEPGVATGTGLLAPHGEHLAGWADLRYFDSLAVDSEGNVCVGTLNHGGITVVSPDGSSIDHVAVDDMLVTNLCFGGEEDRTAFITSSGTGRLLTMQWPVPGLPLAFGL